MTYPLAPTEKIPISTAVVGMIPVQQERSLSEIYSPWHSCQGKTRSFPLNNNVKTKATRKALSYHGFQQDQIDLHTGAYLELRVSLNTLTGLQRLLEKS